MANFDCYCFICAASLSSVSAGSSSPKALARRHRWVERQRRAHELWEESLSPEEEEEEEEDEVPGEEDWDPRDEDYLYDPELVGDTSWLVDVRCLGCKPDDMENLKAFISGPAKYRYYGIFGVRQGTDPNQVFDDDLVCYRSDDAENCFALPFHDRCFDLLSRALTGSDDRSKIDKDALYDILTSLSENWQGTLSIDYGPINGGDIQFWQQIPGEEYTVTQPVFNSEVNEVLRRKITSSDLGIRQQSILQGDDQQITSDPFYVLPHELIWKIASYLPATAVFALTAASRPVLKATRGNDFWNGFIDSDMPWAARELRQIINDARPQKLDYKALYLWFERMTVPKYGVGSPWMGLANRRRIWGTCQEIADYYSDRDKL